MLKHFGLKHKVCSPDVDETPLMHESPKAMVARLSIAKARAGLGLIKDDNYIILAADTTVVSHNGKNLGKPRNNQEARAMLRLILGKTHQVHTGYTLILHDSKNRKTKSAQKITKVVTSKVTMRKLTQNQIDEYIQRGESLDKAGGYAVQGIGSALIEKISGSYTNVVGLPLTQVLQSIEKTWGFHPWKQIIPQ